jgi:hypothetical protein
MYPEEFKDNNDNNDNLKNIKEDERIARQLQDQLNLEVEAENICNINKQHMRKYNDIQDTINKQKTSNTELNTQKDFHYKEYLKTLENFNNIKQDYLYKYGKQLPENPSYGESSDEEAGSCENTDSGESSEEDIAPKRRKTSEGGLFKRPRNL